MSHQATTQPKLRRTPHEEVGPNYPIEKPPDRGYDLTINPRTGERAEGQILYLSGRVINTHGVPIPGAQIEIWQANKHGRYAHPADPNPAPLDLNFESFGATVSDPEGRWKFKTIKPAAYPASSPGWWRPPHIHFDVRTDYNRLCTQMYFPGEPLNDVDFLIARHRKLGDGEYIVAKPAPLPEGAEPDAIALTFDLVLNARLYP
ncbi:MAG: protocatechuate 3,4-dioxygenase, beta subunit [Alphaproteobacteria bacterium]|jgi:protocatechuate 3,4-dioxygenase beta subunit|nr:protocatechuate 3,4-dioxygenase, beta subunit [Alphaproteobacteria bacterium]